MEKKTSPASANGRKTSAAFRTGVIAACFLLIGYETALFVFKAARLSIEQNMDSPDTVFIVKSVPEALSETETGSPALSGEHSSESITEAAAVHFDTIEKAAQHPAAVKREMERMRVRESFRFNPNTVSQADLQRLGFSEKQAAAIVNYRNKGGRFRRKSDFAKSFVVADTVFDRLEPYIDIPKLDLNQADSAALDELPGIGPYFAKAIISHRERLGGYSYPEQLMDIRNFTQDKFDALADLVFCSTPHPFELWTLDEKALSRHPYINSRETAHSIAFYRKHNRVEDWTVDKLKAAGILSEPAASKLLRCVIAEPCLQ